MTITKSVTGRGGIALRAIARTVAAGFTGQVADISSAVKRPATGGTRVSGSASITISAGGVVSLTAALAAGASVTAIATITGADLVVAQIPISISGAGSALPTVSLTSGTVSNTEGNSGTQTISFTVQRSDTVGAIVVPWSFAAGATNAADYAGGVLPTGGTVNIADGQNSGTFGVTISGDTMVEPDENFTVTITAPSGYAAGGIMSATGTILNDDSPAVAPDAPTISVTPGNTTNAISIVDGATGGSPITAHKIYRSGASGGTFSLIATYPIASGVTYNDNQLTNETTYYYKVIATNVAGDSALSNEISGKPTAGASLTPNQTLLAAMPAQPLVAELGGSRERQNGVATGTQVRSLPSGQLTWAEILDPTLFKTAWSYSSGGDVNSTGMNGMLFANDGEGAVQAFQRVPAVLGSDANVVVVAISSNTVQLNDFDIYGKDLGTPLSVANFVGLYQQICLALINGGKAVIFKELWERGVRTKSGTNIGGVWSSGSAPRARVPQINAAMKSWCQQQGIPFLEVRAAMTTTEVNGSITDTIPIADYVREDMTHLSGKGGKVMAGVYLTAFASLFTRGSALDETAAGNLVTNPTFTGAAGTVGSGFTGGSTVPSNTTSARIGTTATVSSAIIVKNGRNWVEFTVDRSTMSSTTAQEGLSLTIAAAAPGAAGAHISRLRVEQDAGDWRGTPNVFGVGNSWGLIPMNNGGSGVTDQTDTMEPMDGVAIVGVLKSQPATLSAAPTYIARTASWKKGDGSILKVRFAAPEIRPVTSTALLMYNEGDTVAPNLTSPTSFTAPEEALWQTFVTTSKPCKLSLSGTDAALFLLKASGRLTMRATPDYENPTDAGGDQVYNINIVMTPFNPNVAAVTVPVTLTITDIADGTIYNFTGANGTDIADLYTSMTKLPGSNGTVPAAGLVVNGNACQNVSGSAAGIYMFPAEASNGDCEVRWAATSGASTAVTIIVRLNPVRNNGGYDRVSIQFGANLVSVGRTSANVSAAAVTFPFYAAPSANTPFIAQIISNVLRVYQDGVEISPTGGISCVGYAEGMNNSGISANSAGASNKIDQVNVRPAVARISKVVLKTLTLTADTLVAGQNYAGTIGNYAGSPNMSATADASGIFYVDGFNLRSTDGLGASGTVYSVTVTETNDNSVNSPKTTTFTITVP